MPLVQAWQCPRTKKLFADRGSYLAHLRREARAEALVKKINAAKRERQKFLAGIKDCSSFEAIAEWVVANSEKLLLGTLREPPRRNARLPYISVVKFENMRWGDRISNTHSCPRDGVTNWGSDPAKPRGYPGWSGRLIFEAHNHDSFFNDPFRELDIHKGSGGGGNPYRYDVKLFESDWPVMGFMRRAMEPI